MEDLPYTEIVTADYTLANGVTSTVWGIPYDGDGEAWETTEWTDGRAKRGDPFRRVAVPAALEHDLQREPRARERDLPRAGCATTSCPATSRSTPTSIWPTPTWSPTRSSTTRRARAATRRSIPSASFWQDINPLFVPRRRDVPGHVVHSRALPHVPRRPDAEKTYFGQPGDDLADLGRLIAGDPRFSMCAAQRFYAYFHQVDLQDVPLQTAADLQYEFMASGYNAKALTKAIVLSDAFRISHVDEGAEDQGQIKKLRPIQMAQLIRSLTGFRWETDLTSLGAPEIGRVDLMADSFLGYGVLAGGIDSIFVTRPSHTYSATSSLVLRNLARYGAGHVRGRRLRPAGRRTKALARDRTGTDRRDRGP